VQTVGPPLFNAVVALLGSLFNLLLSNIPGMINSGVELLLGLVNGLVQAIPELIPAIVQIITQIQTSLINHMPELIEAGLQLIVALGIGLVRAIPDLLAMTPQIITSLINAFSGADWSSIGHNIVAGIWNGISGLWGDLTSKVSNGVTNLWNSAKNALGISSPSKKFKYIGEMSVEGTEEGFEDREAEMTRVVHDVYSGISATAEDALRPTTMSENLERNVSYNLTASGSVDGTYIIVPLNIDGREVARATAWSMGQQLAWEEM
jgi:phage-related protein